MYTSLKKIGMQYKGPSNAHTHTDSLLIGIEKRYSTLEEH